MREIKTEGLIVLRDDLDIEYKISKIEYIEREDESYRYVFTPYYNVIDLLPVSIFQGIPGIDLELRKEQYVRENKIPVFISERAPGKNREDLWELLEQVDMKYLNQLEWLIRTETRYSGDRLYVKSYSEEDIPPFVFWDIPKTGYRARNICKDILDIICSGASLQAEGFKIDDENRKAFYSLLYVLYRNELEYPKQRRKEGIKKASAAGNYKGRQRIRIDDTKAFEIFKAYLSGRLTEAEAVEKFGTSRTTFFRRLKEYKNSVKIEKEL